MPPTDASPFPRHSLLAALPHSEGPLLMAMAAWDANITRVSSSSSENSPPSFSVRYILPTGLAQVSDGNAQEGLHRRVVLGESDGPAMCGEVRKPHGCCISFR